MGRAFRGVAIALLVLVGLVVVIAVLARFSDGPIGPFPGGPLVGGEMASGPPPDWSFAHDVREIEFQTVRPPRSRTVWVLVVDGQLFVPCGYPQVKRWPGYIERDPDVVLRIRGLRYRGRLERVTDPALLARLLAEAGRKYGVGARSELRENTWVYRFEAGGQAA